MCRLELDFQKSNCASAFQGLNQNHKSYCTKSFCGLIRKNIKTNYPLCYGGYALQYHCVFDNSLSSCHCLSFRPHCRKQFSASKALYFFFLSLSLGNFRSTRAAQLYTDEKDPNRAIYLIPPSSKHLAEIAYPN